MTWTCAVAPPYWLTDVGRARLAEGYALTMLELRYQLEACRRGAELWLRDASAAGGAL